MNAQENNDVPARGGFCLGLVTAEFYETWDFYTEQLGFRTLDENGTSVLLVHPSGVRLEILLHETEERYAELVGATDGRGLWLNLEVEDVDAEHARLCVRGVQVLGAPGELPLGRRGFTVRDPNGVLIRVTSPWEPPVSVGESDDALERT